MLNIMISWVALILSITALAAGQNGPGSCRKPGLQCDGCSTAMACLGEPGGSLREILRKTCGPNEVCFEGEGCLPSSELNNPGCRIRPFKCSDEGTFPDPYHCEKFYTCTKEGAELKLDSHSCQPSNVFDVKTMACISGDIGECTSPVPICEFPFQSGIVPGNPNMFFVCTRDSTSLAPELFHCQGDKVFSVETSKCAEPEELPQSQNDPVQLDHSS